MEVITNRGINIKINDTKSRDLMDATYNERMTYFDSLDKRELVILLEKFVNNEKVTKYYD